MATNKLRIYLLDEAKLFIRSVPEKAGKKIIYNMLKVENGEINKELFKKLEGSEIWEFRTLFNGVYYRLFAFWDNVTGALIVATHGIVKKTQKTPKADITKAENIRQEYLENLKGIGNSDENN